MEGGCVDGLYIIWNIADFFILFMGNEVTIFQGHRLYLHTFV